MKFPKLTQEEVIRRCVAVHGDKYDYSKAVYSSYNIRFTVICTMPGHGEFYPLPSNHINNKSGCPACAGNTRLTNEEFILKSKAKYGDAIDYSECNFTKLTDKVILKCNRDKSHLPFYPVAKDHLQKVSGCPDCSGRRRLTEAAFVSRSSKVHAGKYSYADSTVVDNKKPVTIVCSQHGMFSQRPDMHMNEGNGCPKCANLISKGEKALKAFIESLNVKTKHNYILSNGQHIDVLCVDKNIGFEFNGVYWHSEQVGKPASYHLNKTEVAKKDGIRLIHIFEDEWVHKNEIVKSRIRNILGLNSVRYFGRKCVVKDLSKSEAASFLSQTHIQGPGVPSEHNIGLFHEGMLVAVATFNGLRYGEKQEGMFELVRFSSKGTVVGGFSKLLKHFMSTVKPTGIVSYSDKRWSEGNVYAKNGFIHVGISRPGYDWFKGNVRYSRESMQKHKLAAKLAKFDETLSEVENCIQNGYFRAFDCGNDKWKLVVG